MPWCEGCARFYNPNTLDSVGDCPEGHHVADPPDPDVDVEKAPGAPWHFWVLVIGIGIYLGWRLIQGIVWVFEHM